MVTIKQIAERAGVSTATVSNVLHGKIKKVSPETVEKVRKLIDEMGYVQPMGLRVLRKSHSQLVAVIINYHLAFENSVLSDPFYGMVIGVIQEELRKNGYYMMLYSAPDVDSIFKMVMTWNVDGVIAISFSDVNCEKLANMVQKPLISIDRYTSVKGTQVTAPNIGLDDRMGGYLMTNYLLEQGYESIYVCAYRNFGVDATRWQGALQADERSHPRNENRLKMIELGSSLKEREKCYAQLIRQMPFRKRTALFFMSDCVAMEANSYLAESGIRVPADVGIAGFDDSSNAAKFSVPRLTTVHQDFRAKGKLAVGEMVRALQDPEYKMQSHILPVSLVIRNSV